MSSEYDMRIYLIKNYTPSNGQGINQVSNMFDTSSDLFCLANDLNKNDKLYNQEYYVPIEITDDKKPEFGILYDSGDSVYVASNYVPELGQDAQYIADLKDTTIDAIMSANPNLKSPDDVIPGQTYRIPMEMIGEHWFNVFGLEKNSFTIDGTKYEIMEHLIQEGQNLHDIAYEYETTVDILKMLNVGDIPTNGKIIAGKTLDVPVDYCEEKYIVHQASNGILFKIKFPNNLKQEDYARYQNEVLDLLVANGGTFPKKMSHTKEELENGSKVNLKTAIENIHILLNNHEFNNIQMRENKDGSYSIYIGTNTEYTLDDYKKLLGLKFAPRIKNPKQVHGFALKNQINPNDVLIIDKESLPDFAGKEE